MNVDRSKRCQVIGHDFRLMLVKRGDRSACFDRVANGVATACSRCGARP